MRLINLSAYNPESSLQCHIHTSLSPAHTWPCSCSQTPVSEASRQDLGWAVEQYAEAATQGFAAAEFNLGLCYMYGKGVEPDVDRAMDLFSKAAKQGNVNAASALAQWREHDLIGSDDGDSSCEDVD